MTRIVQRLMSMGLLIGCSDVSLSNAHLARYVPWTIFWVATTVAVGAVFILQTVREKSLSKSFAFLPPAETQFNRGTTNLRERPSRGRGQRAINHLR